MILNEEEKFYVNSMSILMNELIIMIESRKFSHITFLIYTK